MLHIVVYVETTEIIKMFIFVSMNDAFQNHVLFIFLCNIGSCFACNSICACHKEIVCFTLVLVFASSN